MCTHRLELNACAYTEGGQQIGNQALELTLLINKRQRHELIIDRHFYPRMLNHPAQLTGRGFKVPGIVDLRPIGAPALQNGHADTGGYRYQGRIDHAQQAGVVAAQGK